MAALLAAMHRRSTGQPTCQQPLLHGGTALREGGLRRLPFGGRELRTVGDSYPSGFTLILSAAGNNGDFRRFAKRQQVEDRASVVI